MTENRATTTLCGGGALLERAIGYTLGSLHLVTPGTMSHPTPCREWDLAALLAHMNDSLIALQEAVDLGHVQLVSPADDLDRPWIPLRHCAVAPAGCSARGPARNAQPRSPSAAAR